MKNLVVALLCVLLPVLTGCGDKLATNRVEGTVTIDGTPLANATVTFSPVSGGSGMIALGKTDTEGKFTLQAEFGETGKGTTEGEYAITVRKVESVPTGKTWKSEDGEILPVLEDKSLVPDLYGKASTTPLKHTIVKGTNTVTLDLSSKP